MGTEVAVWKLGAEKEDSGLERLALQASSLDDGTRQLPSGGYTTFRTFHQKQVLRLQDHFDRLEETARLAGKSLRIDQERVRAALGTVVEAYPAEEKRVRVILDLVNAVGAFYFLVDSLHVPPSEAYHQGVRVVTRQMQRHNPKAKVTSFIETAEKVRETLPEGVNEAVMIGEDGHMLEGLSSNFFVVRDGTVWTAEQGVLSGITRTIVIDVI